MLVLFETPAGFALFKVLDEGKLDKVEVSLPPPPPPPRFQLFVCFAAVECSVD
jgi:NOP5NT (NUC127) domain.